MPLSLLFLRPFVRREISLEHLCSQRNLSFPLRSCRYYSSFPGSALRTASILYSLLMVVSESHFVSLLTIFWIFGGNWTGVDTNLLDSRFSQSLTVG